MEHKALLVILISEGKFVKENLNLAKLEPDFINKTVSDNNIDPNSVIFLSINNDGKMYVQPKTGSFKVIETNFKGGSW